MRYLLLAILAAGLCAFLPAPVLAGLYGDETPKTGDIDDQDYWWTKFDMMMLDLALKQKQPEGKIGINLASTKERLATLSKKYPDHDMIKQWKAKVDDTISKIDPNASRTESFRPGCPWDEANFGQMWVNYNHAKLMVEKNKPEQAYDLLKNVKQNADILTKPDRLKNYPDDLREWVTTTKVEAEKLSDDLKVKLKK
jgi:hypothetical protein